MPALDLPAQAQPLLLLSGVAAESAPTAPSAPATVKPSSASRRTIAPPIRLPRTRTSATRASLTRPAPGQGHLSRRAVACTGRPT